jgi:hypothetical protein
MAMDQAVTVDRDLAECRLPHRIYVHFLGHIGIVGALSLL